MQSRPPPEIVLAALDRLFASSRFVGSESLRKLLRYTVEKALAGQGSELKEYSIGVQALGRPSTFDPKEDNIVRVQARKLRQRLAGYYETEGMQHCCRIVFRPGSYHRIFHLTDRCATTRTVAVLPFMNLTADEHAGYFCDVKFTFTFKSRVRSGIPERNRRFRALGDRRHRAWLTWREGLRCVKVIEAAHLSAQRGGAILWLPLYPELEPNTARAEPQKIQR